MLNCTLRKAVEGWVLAKDKYKDALVTVGAHQVIITMILLVTYEEDFTPHNLMEDGDLYLSRAIRDQTRLGWNLVRYRFLATTWKQAQLSWETRRNPNGKGLKTNGR